MSVEFIFSLNPLCPCHVHPCECGCIHESEVLAFFLFRLVDSTFEAEGTTADAWLYFPGLKGKKNLSLFFLYYLTILVAYVYDNSSTLQLTGTVFSWCFVVLLT
jgi:hypothetical protein